MSSLRNAVQRRNHKERAQPQERQKWGLLEKNKDYKLRAADHKVKKRKIKALQNKADERNEDEFYFAMVNSQSQGGIRGATRGTDNSGGGGKVLKGDVVKLMKTQDAGYLRTMLQQTKRERERVEKDVVAGAVGVSVNVAASGKRRTFGEDGEEVAQIVALRNEALSDDDEDSNDDKEGEAPNRVQAKRRKRLEGLQNRERELATALQEVEQQQARMNGSIGGTNKKGVKFKVRQRAK